MPGERIAQHLSELAPTDVGDHINIHVNVNINGAVKRICSHRLFKFSYFVLGKRFSLPQIAHVIVLYRENVLDGTKSQCSTVSG